MKILHFIDTLGVGGAETLLKDTIIQYKKRFPEDEHLVMTLYRGGGYEQVIRSEAVYFNLNFTPAKLIQNYCTFRAFLNTHKIDIVHSHLNESTIIARLFTPSSVKLVSTYHSGYLKSDAWNYSYKRLLAEKFGLKKTHYCLFVSDSVAKDTIPALGLKSNYEVLKNFFDERFKPKYVFKNDDKLRLVTVGNLSRQKNQKLILEALKRMNNPNISLDIYGEGNLREELQHKIDIHNLPVRLMGRTFITSELLAAYDLFILSSLNEGLSIAQIEAMATGMPAMYSKVASLQEVGKDAALFFQNNSVSDLMEKLKEVYDNKTMLKDMSIKAIEYAKEYSAENKIIQLNRVYKKLLAQ